MCLVAATGWSVAGCAGTPDGFGVPRQPAPGEFPGPRQDITGVVTVQGNGCLDLDLGDQGLRWIVWPDTTTVTDDGATVVVGDHSVSDGDVVTGTGTLVDASVLPGWDSDPVGYFGGFGRFCGAGELGVVVLDEATVTSG